MVVDFDYFRSMQQTAPDNINRRNYIQSGWLYYWPWIRVEIPLLISATWFLAKNITQNLLYQHPILAPTIIILCGIMVIILWMDVINLILGIINQDIMTSLTFDFKFTNFYTSRRHRPDYRCWSQLYAYKYHKQYNDQSTCTICMGEYEDGEEQQILNCGHSYHKSCLEQYEYHKWNNCDRNWPHPYCECPLCRRQYHADVDKYDYDKNFKQPLWFTGIQYPGHDTVHNLIWNGVSRRYAEHSSQQRREYVTWNTNYCDIV